MRDQRAAGPWRTGRLLSVARTTLAMAFRADRRSATTLVLVIMVNALGTSLIGLALAALVNEASDRDIQGVVVAVALSAACQALLEVGFRVQFSLRVDIAQRVKLLVEQDIVEMAATMHTIEHLEDTEHLDRVASLRENSEWLADSCWSVLEAGSIAIQIGLAASMLAVVNPAFISLLVLALPSVWLSSRARAVEQKAVDRAAEHNRLAEQLLAICTSPTNAKDVCVTNVADVLRGRSIAAWETATTVRVRAEVRASLLNLCGFLLFTFGFIGAMAYSAYSAATGRGEVGDVILVVTLAGRLQAQIGHGVWLVGRLVKSMLVAERYVWLREKRQHGTGGNLPAPQRLTDGISLRKVSFTYPGSSREVLHEIDLHIPAGTVVALVGENGAGKSTLVQLLAKLYTPTIGEVLVDGFRLSDIKTDDWRSRVTAAYQDYARFEFLVRESVGLGDVDRMRDERVVRDGVARAGATETVVALADGLDTRLGRTFDGVDLSHGQWQLLALARACMRDMPLLVLLDEPSASLDARTEHDLYERFAELATQTGQRTGAITLLVSHRFSTVQMADLILVIQEGRITQSGRHKDLVSVEGFYREMYQAQARGYR